MSSEDHRDDAAFQAAGQRIGQAIADRLRELVIEAAAGHPSIAGHEHCLADLVLRNVLAFEMVDCAQQIARGAEANPKTALRAFVVQHAQLLARDAGALLETLARSGKTLTELADETAQARSEEQTHAVH